MGHGQGRRGYARGRRLLAGVAGVVGVAGLAAGCGGGSKPSSSPSSGPSRSSSSSPAPNHEASKPADQILKDAQAATGGAASVHVAGSGTEGGSQFTLDVVAAQGAGGGTVGESGATFQVVLAGGKVYLKADAPSLQRLTNSSSAATLFADRWLTSSANSGFSDLGSLVDISKLADNITPGGSITVGAETSVNGVPVIPLNDRSGGTLYVAATGKPYMIALKGSGSNAGVLNFDQYNSVRPPAAPSGALDLDQLDQGT